MRFPLLMMNSFLDLLDGSFPLPNLWNLSETNSSIALRVLGLDNSRTTMGPTISTPLLRISPNRGAIGIFKKKPLRKNLSPRGGLLFYSSGASKGILLITVSPY